MFAKRDWGMIGLIVLAQVGLVICYWGLQPQNNQAKLASAFIEKPKPAFSPKTLPGSPATKEDAVAVIEPPPEPPGTLIPASLKTITPLEKTDPKIPELPPPPAVVKNDSKLPDLPPPSLPDVTKANPGAVVPSLPPLPGIEDQLVQNSKKPDDKKQVKQEGLDPKKDAPPLPPGIPEPGKNPPTPEPAPGVPDIPIPPGTPPTKLEFLEKPGKTDPPKPETTIKPPAVPEAPPLVPLTPGNLKDFDPAGKPLTPPPPGNPVPPLGTPKSLAYPPVSHPGPDFSEATPPQPKVPGPSPWKLQMALVNQRTHVTARTEKGTTFVIRCQEFQFSRTEGKIEATGKVEIEGKDMQASCDRLSISWSDNRVFLDGNATLKNWRNGELMTLKGPQLELQLSGVD